VAATVASWYTTAHSDQGYTVERRPFGWYRTNRDAPTWGAVTATPIDAVDLPAFLTDVEEFFGKRDLTIEFTEPPAAMKALFDAGWSDWDETVYLAHVGELPKTIDVDATRVDDANVEAFARTKLQSFDDTEDDPNPSTLADEVEMRRAELRGEGRGLIAHQDGEPATMCAFYSGEDYFVFLLGTRIPFRGRGIASAVLRHVLEDAQASNARSVVINARAGARPDALYRHLGFTDVVHRRWRLRKPP
jgi:ribosomal protein S18 acetylase RimI-like enzyme